ncbi:alginate export family protein [Flavobacterium rakeshii]|uniref:alginate export family protein n=1 Tax=Flavobacterium rakeshii TaxID=1038845 RepID=UPI002E7BB32D|nr:alginate export family protein [Flavobacterium rakeshii]MEE1898431.1 alginate export family protein [Flavobacterium rakeshii]
MRTRLIILLLFVLTGIHAQTPPRFSFLRYNDDFSYLATEKHEDIYYKMKYIRVGKNSDNYLSTGGEIRYQYINTINEKWGDDSNGSDGYFMARYLAHVHLHTKYIRLFFQLQSSFAYSKADVSPVDENPLDVHQFFADVVFTKHFFLRAGRQEILFGSRRLVGVREGPNSRLAFDGWSIIFKSENNSNQLFYVHPVANRPQFFDDNFNRNAKLWGNYTVVNNVPLIQNIDLYYLGLYKSNASFNDASGKEVRHSVGTRIWKNKGNLTYNFETVYQFGKMAGKTISAWTVSSQTNYQFNNIKFSPTVGLKTEIISGDRHANDNSLETFNPLYPRGAYFGLVALIGPSNLFDIHPSLDFNLSSRVSAGIDYDFFWRWSINDGIYAPNVQLVYSGQNLDEKFIGTQLAANLNFDVNPFLSLTAEAAWFDAGPFLKEAGTGKDYYYGAVTAQFKF